MDSYHKIESLMYNWILQCGLAVKGWMLAFRAIIQRPLEYFLKNEAELFCEHDPKYGLNLKKGETVHGDNDVYKSYFNLVTMDEYCNFNQRHFRAFATLFIVQGLQKVGYFQHEDMNHKLLIGNAHCVLKDNHIYSLEYCNFKISP